MTTPPDMPDDLWIIRCVDETGEEYFDACRCPHPKEHGYDKYTRTQEPVIEGLVEAIEQIDNAHYDHTLADHDLALSKLLEAARRYLERSGG